MKPTWDWILTVMDSTEAQLRFGASLTDSTDAAHPLHPSNGTAPAAAAPSEYLKFLNSMKKMAKFLFYFLIEKFSQSFNHFAFDQKKF